MENSQFGVLVAAIVAGLGGIAAAIRWSVGIISQAIGSNTVAMIENTKSNAILSTKIDKVSDYVEKRITQSIPPPISQKQDGRTPHRGIPKVPRPKTGEEE